MPQKKKSSSSSGNSSKQLSDRTEKQIDSLPHHAQEIYKAHASALQQYKDSSKRRGGKRQSAEEVAHKTAWAAVKKKYRKEGNDWFEK
jgi:cation transport regulator